MISKEITYKDLDGNPVTETFWFHMSKAELAEMALSKEGAQGGFDMWVKKIQESNDGAVIIKTFKEIILATVGRRSEDNKRFIKNDEIRNDFLYSDAYSEFFMQLMMNTDQIVEFINGVVPTEMREEAAKAAKEVQNGPDISSVPATPRPVEAGKDDRPAYIRENREPTADELKKMTQEELAEAFKRRLRAPESA